jgi:hypothetical protein
MPDTIEKLRPDRDLQCFYFDQSAIAALSETSPTGFKVTGSWRQQFDWAVIEWNCDNVFEHPAFRTLPDGDLSGLTLTYDETRENCIPLDSDLSPTVDWPYLRIWAGDNGSEEIYFVKLADHATAIAGLYSAAYAEFTLSGTITAGDYVGLAYTGAAFTGLSFTYQVLATDTLATTVQAIVDGMNGLTSPVIDATRTGTTIRAFMESATTGANGNRFGLFAYASGTAVWDSTGQTFANGTSPTKWQISLDFSTLQGRLRNFDGTFGSLVDIPTDKVRKMRWTYAADQQVGEFARAEFGVGITNWTVTGTGRTYSIAGPGSRRIDDIDPLMSYTGAWTIERGNYSGGMIHYTSTPGDSVTVTYRAAVAHTLYVGTRYLDSGAQVSFEVDGDPAGSADFFVDEEDVLIRWAVGDYPAGAHTLTVTHSGTSDERLYFDFVELAAPSTNVPTFPSMRSMTLATDWDTLHSVAIAPERTAWMIRSLGFDGRQNHYVGALLFYELFNPDNVFASGTVTFGGTAEPGKTVWVEVGPSGGAVHVERIIQFGETLDTVALSFAQEFNRGYTTIRAQASGGVLTIYSRELGTAGEAITVAAYTDSTTMKVALSGSTLDGAVDGVWYTDLTATPRLNRAMRDWTRSFLAALHGYGIDAACAFSTEIKHGDPSATAGIAQRDVAGDPILLPTPALQTNFSPTSLEFWKQVHADCAQVMDEAGVVPYLQFGEEQWWYFPHDGRNPPERVNFASMPFYDAWTTGEFLARYSRAMEVFYNSSYDPADYPDEMEFLSNLIGEFTDAVMAHVRASQPTARFEVLYPYDVNSSAFNAAFNFPTGFWTPSSLDCLKTEGLGLTFTRNLEASEQGIGMGGPLGFESSQRAHLVGLGDSTAPWLKEMRIAEGQGFESIVGFALDQFCLIGYAVPLPRSTRRAVRIRR